MIVSFGFIIGCGYSLAMYKYMKKKDLDIIIQEMQTMRHHDVMDVKLP